MKFVLESVSKCTGRVGILSSIERLPGKTFRTPMLMIMNPQLSREVLELSGVDLSRDLAVALPIFNVEQMEKPVKNFKKTLSEFVGLKEALTFITLKNSSELMPTMTHEKGAVPLAKRSGRVNVTPQRYMDMIETFQPDFYTNLADGDTFENCSKKRVAKSCERSEEMFLECLERKKASKSLSNSSMIACVVGAYNEFERKKMVEQLKGFDDDIVGYFIDGLHRNGHEATSINVPLFKQIVGNTVSMLPNDKMKIMFGAYLPHITLELVSMGVDIFDTSFVNLVTNANRAIVFDYNLNDPKKVFPEIDLADSKYKEDFTPFVENCQCYACRKHTRAYTNHLLNTRELLGPMLLSIHNLYHYMSFFEAVRDAVRNDTHQRLLKLISDQYQEASELNYKPEEKLVENKENK